jgi:hypothetical protein
MDFNITINTNTNSTTHLIADAHGVLGGWVAPTSEKAIQAAISELRDVVPSNAQLIATDTGAHLGDLQEDEARWVAAWLDRHAAIFTPYEGELTTAVKRVIDGYLSYQGVECDPSCTFWGLTEEDSVVLSPTGEIAIYSPPGLLWRAAGDLHDYETGDVLRAASPAEARSSEEAATADGGAGVIKVEGRSCYVQ